MAADDASIAFIRKSTAFAPVVRRRNCELAASLICKLTLATVAAPMPTPFVVTHSFCTELAAIPTVLAADKNIPFVGTDELDGMKDAPVTTPDPSTLKLEDLNALVAIVKADRSIPFVTVGEPSEPIRVPNVPAPNEIPLVNVEFAVVPF